MLSLTVLWLLAAAAPAAQIDYSALWNGAARFDEFLASVKEREAQWTSRFANAAIDPETLTRVRALREKRRLLVVAEARCRDSAWAVPYVAKLAAVAPDRLELRVIGAARAAEVQAANPTPDGRRATPTIVILDESNRPLAAWVERPAALHRWVMENTAALSRSELHRRMEAWYSRDAGRSTVREILAALEASTRGGA